ncbi:energy-coupling factor transporter transmembrane component T family protein [Desulfosoma caldarium]|uniref:Energy-coupling factor transporter transmembrane protein EcfT n=1 Tax=Desulfosoma caldarium TaxID=610254 RepID=A0A3N1UDP3_9BACT|nr:energy-coupling factor transporter transmembrane component T [Desulfosoma caldarium]ROQ89532.1 energy-coupling factor transporter transmembrane protein EcfT [Desulfosoma caldarium]
MTAFLSKTTRHTSCRLDPRVRLFLGLLAIIVVLLTKTLAVLLIESLLLAVALFIFSRAKRRLSSFRLAWPMVSLVFVMAALALDLETAVHLSLRLTNLFAASAMFFQTLDAEEWAVTLRAMKVPYSLVFILMTSLRYVPLLGRSLRHIYDAQTARGIDVRFRLRNVGRLLALVMPLLVQAFVLAENLAMAMESRGFGRTPKSNPRLSPLSLHDVLLAALGFVVALALWFWERFQT